MPKWQLGKGSFLAIKLMQLKMLGIVKALTKIKHRIPLIKLN
jgi:hypothetical protein